MEITLDKDSPLTLRQCRPGLMLFRKNDAYIGRSFDLYGEFSEGEHTLFKGLIDPEMTVIDVGANIGAHTLSFARLANCVIAIESSRVIHQMLCANLVLNDVQNVWTLHAAAGAQDGVTLIPDINFNEPGNFGCVPAFGHEQGTPTRLVRIDSLKPNRCDFIKIDVEGMESQVLLGAQQTIGKFRPVMYIENDRKENSAALISLLFSFGYTLYWHGSMLFNPDNYNKNPENVFGGTGSFNMLCAPDDSVKMEGWAPISSPDDWWDSFMEMAP